MRPIVRTKTVKEWVEVFEKLEIVGSPVYDMKVISEDPQFQHNGMIVEMKSGTGENLRVVGIAPKLSRTPGEIRRHPPGLGEHTPEILDELDYSDEEIGTFVREHVV